MCLYLRQVNVSPQVMLGHAKGLQHHNIIIPFNAHKVFTKMIVQGVLSDVSINFLEGIYPKLVIVGLVDHAAYTGTYNKKKKKKFICSVEKHKYTRSSIH